MNMTIRAATRDDVDALALLRPSVHDQHVTAHPEFFKPVTRVAARAEAETWLQQEHAHVRIAMADGEAVGYLLAQLYVRPEGGLVHARRTLHIDQIAVLESHRGRGCGTALLDAARALARELGVDAIDLEVWDFNERARRFFIGQGFAPFRERLSQALP